MEKHLINNLLQDAIALQRSNKYIVWSLTWEDIVEKLPNSQNPLTPNGLNDLDHRLFTNEKPFDRWWSNELLKSINSKILKSIPSLSKLQKSSSLELLMLYLINPNEEWWNGLAQLFSLAQVSKANIPSSEIEVSIMDLNLQDQIKEWSGSNENECYGKKLKLTDGFSILNLANLMGHQTKDPYSSLRALYFDPIEIIDENFKQDCWREWLRQINIFQFLPHLFIFTKNYKGDEQSTVIENRIKSLSKKSRKVLETSGEFKNLDKLQKLINPSYEEFFIELKEEIINNNISIPEIGFELVNSKGVVLSEAEIAWPEIKFAITVYPEDDIFFINEGWEILSIKNPPSTIIESLIKKK